MLEYCLTDCELGMPHKFGHGQSSRKHYKCGRLDVVTWAPQPILKQRRHCRGRRQTEHITVAPTPDRFEPALKLPRCTIADLSRPPECLPAMVRGTTTFR